MPSSSSAIQVTGVGPRFAFTFNGDAPPTVDNVIGVDVTATRGGAGEYVVTHNLGHTGYVVSVTPEMATSGEINCTVTGRHGNTFGIHCEIPTTEVSTDVEFMHGIIYD